MCDFRNSEINSADKQTLNGKVLKPENLCFGVGSDESIDAIMRVLCVPGKDKLLTCPPTYGMYAVSAQINDVEVVSINMNFIKGKFSIKPDEINARLAEDPSIKLAYICSPGNPTGSLIEKADIIKVLEHPTWNGIVVVDEAYIDFAPEGTSMAPLVNKYPNLLVMQTLSKSFGLAGVRCGVSFASPDLSRLLNSMKAPYNISTPTARLASRVLSPEGIKVMKGLVKKIIVQRDRLVRELPKLQGIGEFVGGEDANFLLVEIIDKDGKPSNDIARQVYTKLAEFRNVIVRYRGKEPGCTGCLRISIGNEEETTILLKELQSVLAEIYSE
ncbi:histidinol-phosphate transaminase [Sugiyamaella lignohabitans]|uniref:histidinol-phosphate transaminase n=1 Tax=Sugiyamaella lignohabitans TaxID=796027 RepID=A0A161HLG2_9ASCO|nr:histidinol-phosphate transaminase [Sugiyamaella lignohabitans]ANB12908.1 histidinol-phosphate transaminase [Sugiyamaella lignohabitans]